MVRSYDVGCSNVLNSEKLIILTIAVFKSFWVLDGNFASNVRTTRRNKSIFWKTKSVPCLRKCRQDLRNKYLCFMFV